MQMLMKMAVAVVFVLGASGAVAAEKISILDRCDPSDPGWAPTGGCTLQGG